MAVTVSRYNHTPKLFLNKEIDFSKLKVELLSNSASFSAAHTGKHQVDNAAAPATVTVTIASPGVFTWTGHGFSAGQPVLFKTTGALPTGLSPDTWYYVISAGLTADNFQVAVTPGGSAINTSGSQSGTHTGYASGSYEVHGNGWAVGGPTLANVVVTQAAIDGAASNDAMLDADDVVVGAAGGTIGPGHKAQIYDAGLMKPLALIDFGQAQQAGDTTDFKIRWNANGIFNLLNTSS